MTDGFHFTACCPKCGGELLTDGYQAKVDAPDQSHHDARCDRCLDVIRVTVTTAVVEPWPIDRTDLEARRREVCEDAASTIQIASVG